MLYLDVQQKLAILADAAKYDASCASSGSQRAGSGKLGNTQSIGICHSYTPDGRCVSLLKILLTNYCIYDCAYCVNRLSSDVKRAKFTVDEVVWLTLEFYRRNYIEGLFLSSGIIASPDQTMEELIEVARQLRTTHSYGGYIHLKAVAGCSKELLEKAGLWADRLSANIEMPRQEDLDLLAPAKTIAQVETSMGEIRERLQESKEEARKSPRAPRYAPAGQSTQMVVGVTGSTDADVITTADRLYKNFNLKRIYYSAFSPIPSRDARLPVQAPPLMREHRLYQADWLIRNYGFGSGELFTAEQPNLRSDVSPKLGWALRNRDQFPVNVNRASRGMLLRVPGLGVRNVERILKIRRYHRVRYEDLAKLRVNLTEAQCFVEVEGGMPHLHWLDRSRLDRVFAPPPQQLSLFDSLPAGAGRTAAG